MADKGCDTCRWEDGNGSECEECQTKSYYVDGHAEFGLWEPKKEPKTAPKNNIQEGKPKMSLLPMDLLKKYLVPAYEEGLVKYHRESWRGGFKTSIMIDAAMRHVEEFYWGGQDIDQDSPTKKHHLGGAIFSLLCVLYSLEIRPELDDRPIKNDKHISKG